MPKGMSPAAKESHLRDTTQPSSIYNAGNDDVNYINRFCMPSLSISPSLPSTDLRSPVLVTLYPSGGNAAAVLYGGATQDCIKGKQHGERQARTTSSTSLSTPVLSVSRSVDAALPAKSGLGASLSTFRMPLSPASPLPPLSPRGLRLADAERVHKLKCMNRIVEKRRKASDGIRDIITYE
ncbi:hypothetical protein EMMF5_000541 [Cystobasidiomycetes sp. EMM_F5]